MLLHRMLTVGDQARTTPDLRARKRMVLDSWQREMRPEAGVTSSSLVEPIADVFEQIVGWLEGDNDRMTTLCAAVDVHTTERFRHGFTIENVVREYGRLRQCLVPELGAPGAIAQVDHVIDVAIARATSQYLRLHDEMRERFIGVLAHDLRTPLSCVTMASEILLDDERSAQERSRLQLIVDASERMARMVSDVLSWARENLGDGFATTTRPEDFGAIVQQAVAETRMVHGEDSVQFEAAGDLRGRFDKDRVHQAITNLLRNAIEHGDGPARVTVSETDGGDRIVLVVSNDNGGRSPSSSEIVDPFRRRKRPTNARGLGLYIVDQITRAHGATLEMSSTFDETNVTIGWPTRRTVPPEPR